MGPLQWALAIFGIGVLIAWHELGHYCVARLLGMRVLKYSIGFGPKLVGFRRNDIDYQIGWVPLGGFVQIKGMSALEEGAEDDPRSFISRPRWARFLVLGAGPAFNYLMALVLVFAYLFAWPSPVSTTAVEVTDVIAGRPAAAAGLQVGDVVVSLDGNTFTSNADFKRGIVEKDGAPVTLDVIRDEQRFTVTLAPATTPDGDRQIGVSTTPLLPSMGVLDTAQASINFCINESLRTVVALGALFRREPGVDVGGPVAIVADIKSKIAAGARSFIWILALLSVNLGLFNLLPVPALDGMKMIFLVVEGVGRRNLNAKFQVWVNAVGLLFLLGLLVVISARDTIRIFG